MRWIRRVGKATTSAVAQRAKAEACPPPQRWWARRKRSFAHPTNRHRPRRRGEFSLPLNPLRCPAPQRVAMLGSEETEMPDLLHPRIVRRDADDLRLGRGKSRAQQFHRGPRRPGIIRKADRAQCALVFFEIRKARQL